MTNDTKTQKRRNAVLYYVEDEVGALRYMTTDPGNNKILETWHRADLALAAQGALIERAALIPMDRLAAGDSVAPMNIGAAIQALSPDATAALEAVRREAVEQERARIAQRVKRFADTFDGKSADAKERRARGVAVAIYDDIIREGQRWDEG